MQLKIALGKLTLSRPLAEVVAAQCQAIFGIEPAHVYRLGGLPFHHNDPFDRMIIAQALVEGMTIITSDGEFGPYGVAVLW
jgi:PIN domain nuclease of toxin-antitoxin system